MCHLPNAAVLYPFIWSTFGNGALSWGTHAVYPGKPPDSSPINPNPTAWWLRPVSNAARVGEHNAVTWNRLYRAPSPATRSRAGGGNRAAERTRLPEPRIIEQYQQDVRRALRRGDVTD
jgi:hypothetical protein